LGSCDAAAAAATTTVALALLLLPADAMINKESVTMLLLRNADTKQPVRKNPIVVLTILCVVFGEVCVSSRWYAATKRKKTYYSTWNQIKPRWTTAVYLVSCDRTQELGVTLLGRVLSLLCIHTHTTSLLLLLS